MTRQNEDDLVSQIEQTLKETGFDPFTLLPLSTTHFPETFNTPMGTLSLPAPTHPSAISAPVPGLTIQMQPTFASSSSQSNLKETPIRNSPLKPVPETRKRKHRIEQKSKKIMMEKKPEKVTQSVSSNSTQLTLQTRSDVLSFAQATELLLSHYDNDIAPHVFANSENGKRFKLALHRKLIPKIFLSITSKLDPNILISHDDLSSLALVIYPQIGFYSFESAPSSSS